MREVCVKDGASSYTLTRDDDQKSASLEVKGPVTPKLARELIADLAPLAGAKKARAAGAPATTKSAPVKPEGGT